MFNIEDHLIPIELELSQLATAETKKLCRVDPHGSLYARKGHRDVVTFSWRWTHQGVNDSEVIGPWDQLGDRRSSRKTAGGWTLKAAIREAERMAGEHDDALPTGGFRAYAEHLQRVTRELESVEGHSTFGELMGDYMALLISQGKAKSAKDVRTITAKHIARAHPTIYEKAAALVTKDDIIAILNTINVREHALLAIKARSIMRTAFHHGVTAGSPGMPEHFKHYGLLVNPVLQVATPKRGGRKPIKHLTQAQLRTYWEALKAARGIKAAMLQVQLLSGGHRLEQLSKLLNDEITDDYFTLYDPKGRSGVPRPFSVPMTPAVQRALNACMPRGKYALSMDGGETPVSAKSLRNWFKEIAGSRLPGFSLKHVRAGIETLLARFKVDKHTRGRLQSHGVHGVQDESYDAYNYLDEKIECLQLIEWVLTDPNAAPAPSALAQHMRQRTPETV